SVPPWSLRVHIGALKRLCVRSVAVTVQSRPRAGRSDGAAVPWSARKANSDRPCWRQEAATVSSRSATRLGQLPTERRCFAVRALLPTPQQPPQPCLERHQSPLQLWAVELPCSEAVPEGKKPLDFAQPPAANRLRRAAAVHQGLEGPL